ncbi:MAG: hypothetical protein VW802_12435 [Rhodospirillaceae bacterium]|jgi:hypothetical protein
MTNKLKQYALISAKVAGAVFLLALLVHMSWNMFAPDLFGLAKIKMKQALGIVIFAGLLSFIFAHGLRKHTHTSTSSA